MGKRKNKNSINEKNKSPKKNIFAGLWLSRGAIERYKFLWRIPFSFSFFSMYLKFVGEKRKKWKSFIFFGLLMIVGVNFTVSNFSCIYFCIFSTTKLSFIARSLDWIRYFYIVHSMNYCFLFILRFCPLLHCPSEF